MYLIHHLSLSLSLSLFLSLSLSLSLFLSLSLSFSLPPPTLSFPPSPSPPSPHYSHLCINGHMEHSQQGIDALPDMLCGHLSLDPSIIADVSMQCHDCQLLLIDIHLFLHLQFLSIDSEHLPVPDYDMVDTAVSDLCYPY